jgi:hypothetical protein
LSPVGDAANQRPDLVDHLGVIGTQRDARVGVPGCKFQRLRQAVFDLAAQPLRQRLDDRDALAVATEREGMQIPGVGVVRRLFLLLLAALRDLAKQRALALVIGFEILA